MPDDTPLAHAEAALSEGDDKAALALLRPLADAGEPRALFYLARFTELGRGVVRDPIIAVGLYRRAGEAGVVEAWHNLGTMLRDGQGLQVDWEESARCFRRAADKGHREAQLSLGALYANGHGVPKDPIEALAWLWLAATAGSQLAVDNAALVASWLSESQLEEAGARAETLDRRIRVGQPTG